VNEQIGLNLSYTCPVLLIIKLETIVVNMLSLFIGASLKLNAFYKKIFLKKSHIFTKCIIIPVMADFNQPLLQSSLSHNPSEVILC